MATDAAPVVDPGFVAMDRACVDAAKDAALLLVVVAWLVVEYDVACEAFGVAVDDVTVAFCKLAPCTLKADRKLPRKGLLVVGILAMYRELLLALLPSYM